MDTAFALESTLTDRYQTTVPEAVRRALKLGKRDKIHYTVQANGQVIITRAEEHDPVVDAFLQWITRDMTEHPQRLQSVDVSWAEHIRSAVSGVALNLEAELSTDDE